MRARERTEAVKYVELTQEGTNATVRLNRGKVNALNETVLEELRHGFKTLSEDEAIRTVVLTGSGPFFSFGFDIPELYHYTREKFTRFLTKFTGLYRYLFLYPKPVVAAINGHAIAGGCMLATACDHRIMVSGKAKISLNEITFGASVFQGSVEMLRYWVGGRVAQDILFSGAMYTAEEALKLGLIHEVTRLENLPKRTVQIADKFTSLSPSAFAHMKKLLRRSALDRMQEIERESIEEFIEIWYSDKLRENLRSIKIRD